MRFAACFGNREHLDHPFVKNWIGPLERSEAAPDLCARAPRSTRCRRSSDTRPSASRAGTSRTSPQRTWPHGCGGGPPGRIKFAGSRELDQDRPYVAQVVEQLIRNQQVGGSSPPVGSMHLCVVEQFRTRDGLR